MNEQPRVVPLIDRLIELEEALSSLYTMYASKFPVHAEVWNKMSNEEKNHELFLRKMKDLI